METVEGTRVIAGTDLDDGSSIIVARSVDLSDEPFPYEFAMLDPGTSICDFFVFDKTGPDQVEGADVLTGVSGGRCAGFLTGRLNPMVGTRTGRLSSGVTTSTSPHSDAVLENREALAVAGDAQSARAAVNPATAEAASGIAQRLVGLLKKDDH